MYRIIPLSVIQKLSTANSEYILLFYENKVDSEAANGYNPIRRIREDN